MPAFHSAVLFESFRKLTEVILEKVRQQLFSLSSPPFGYWGSEPQPEARGNKEGNFPLVTATPAAVGSVM